jgi:hypothetical protein
MLVAASIFFLRKYSKERFVADPGRNDISETEFMNRVYTVERKRLKDISDAHRKVSEKVKKEYDDYLQDTKKKSEDIDTKDYQAMGSAYALIQNKTIPYSFMNDLAQGLETDFDGAWTLYDDQTNPLNPQVKDYNQLRGFPSRASIEQISRT